MTRLARIFVLVTCVPALYLITACGGSSGSSCNTSTSEGCDSGQVCELTSTGKAACFDPVVLKGMVFDLSDDTPIEGARVVARDANGSVASNVAVSDVDGNYELTVAVTRDGDGNPVAGQSVTLRADASGYQTFPGGVRQALPVDVSAAVNVAASAMKANWVVDTALTDIGLIALAAGAGTASISGTVELPDDTLGALVVAEVSSTEAYTAIAGRDGEYEIFNLPAGTYSLTAYVQGVNYTPQSVTLAAGENAQVDLSLNNDAAATLNGSVQIVNAPGGSATSVILVVESTFNEALVRGETPPGLRAPAPGTAPNITGAFTIDGIPAGTYVILAAFENDQLVRDPDTCISGTAIIHQAFTSGQTVDLSSGFKITEALEVISPGANGPEAVTSAEPVFSWVDDSSEDNYDIVVFDSLGNKVWETSIAGTSGSNPSVQYNSDGLATPLESGMYYQFRVTSTKAGCELSQTEDLKGVFYLQ